MNKDQITAWAREAGFDTDLPGFQDGSAIAFKLAALAYAAGAEAEREACVKRAEVAMLGASRELTLRLIRAIRARGQTP